MKVTSKENFSIVPSQNTFERDWKRWLEKAVDDTMHILFGYTALCRLASEKMLASTKNINALEDARRCPESR